MTSHKGLLRIGVILLFVIAFTVVGWTVPAFYATYAPSENFVEVHQFSAQNASISDADHQICFDRTVKTPSTGEVFTELYLINGDDSTRIEVASDAMDRYLQEGRTEAITSFELPDRLEAGTYQYLLVIKMDLASDRVTRDFTYTSEPFEVVNNSVEQTEPCN